MQGERGESKMKREIVGQSDSVRRNQRDYPSSPHSSDTKSICQGSGGGHSCFLGVGGCCFFFSESLTKYFGQNQ